MNPDDSAESPATATHEVADLLDTCATIQGHWEEAEAECDALRPDAQRWRKFCTLVAADWLTVHDDVRRFNVADLLTVLGRTPDGAA